MKKPPFYLSLLFTGILIISCSPQANSPKQEKKQPNILFLFADDMTYHAINALGNEEIHTPNLDKLVKGGTTFTNAYNMGGWNGAVCVASRAMMISGKSIWNAKQFIENWKEGDSTLVQQTWGQQLQAVGYDTYMSGKWHVEIPADQVFQEVKHIRPGMPKDAGFFGPIREWIKNGKQKAWGDIMPAGYNRPLNKQDQSWSPSDTSFGGFWAGGKHWSEVLKDDALSFIEMASKKENPFFMYLAFNAPHDPRQAPASFVDQYPLENISIPPNFLPLYSDKDSIGCGRLLRDEALAPFPRTELAVKVHIQEYYAIITHLDEQIGKILKALEAQEELDNTYIFFTADHGLAVGRHGLIGKQNMYDHSIRVPFLMVGPGVPANKKVAASIYLQDIHPTSMALAGAAQYNSDFQNLLPIASGESIKSKYNSIYGCYMDYQRMIRKDGFKLIVYPTLKKVKLFNVSIDPHEMNDISKQAAYQEKTKMLAKELMQLQKDMNDELELDILSWIS